jgi:predicted permease
MSWLSRLRNAVAPRRLDADLRDEMADHLARRTEALRREGFSDDEARRMAAVQFGNATQIREQSREIRLASTLETTFQDIRYAWRGMRKSPAFALTAIGSLALAIGANTAIYSIVDAALLRPLPVPEPDRLVTLTTPGIQEPGKETAEEDEAFSYPQLQMFRTAAGDSARLGLFSYGSQTEVQLPDKNAPIERAICSYASGDAFEILRVPPALGRVFSPEDERVPLGHPYLVISYDYWQRRFHGDRAVLGQRIEINRHSFTIVGVARKGFSGIEPGTFVDIWMPAMMYRKEAFTNLGWSWFRVLGRLAPGTSAKQLQVRLQPVYTASQVQLIEHIPTMPSVIQEQFRKRPILVQPGSLGASGFQRSFARPLWIVLGVAAGILLIACANVASLLLARATARSTEMAMRISLGAGRSRLIRQLLTESLLLSAIAGALGWCLAQVVAPVLVAMLSEPNNPLRFALSMDTRVLLFSTAVATLAAILFGLFPAWQASGAQPMRQLHGLRTQAGKLRLGRVFVGIQVAFAFVLVIGGATFLFSLRNLFNVDTGFNPHNVAVISVSTELSGKQPELNVFLDELQRRIESQTGVQSTALSPWAIFMRNRSTNQVILPGQPAPDREEYSLLVSPRFFSTMRIPLLAGRDFEPRDRDETGSAPRPAIVNQALAQRYFGGANPVGKIFQTPNDGKLDNHVIVGLVANSSYESLREGFQPIFYFVAGGSNYVSLYIRSTLDLGSVVAVVQRETDAMGHGTRIRNITTLDALIGNTLLREKLLAGLGGTFAFLGLLLAAIGLFGLLNYSVTRRTREIGIRAALGARPPALVFLVMKDMFATIGGGLLAGLLGSFAVMTLVRSLLFGIRPVDPLVIATAAAIFLAAALIAGGLPARRAATIDPMIALRQE